MKITHVLFILIISLLITSCKKKIYDGYAFEENTKQFNINSTTKTIALAILGSPTFETHNNNLVYVSVQKYERLFFLPKVDKVRSLILTFDKNDILVDIKESTYSQPKNTKLQFKDIKI